MTISVRLAAAAFLVAGLGQGAMAAPLMISTFGVSPSNADINTPVKFAGTIKEACATTAADAACQSGVIAVDPNAVGLATCMDTSGDGQCADLSAEVQQCNNLGRVWVFIGAFEGKVASTSVGISRVTGACAAKDGSFSGTFSTSKVTTPTRVGIYASLNPIGGVPAADPDGGAGSGDYYSANLDIDPRTMISSLSCTPQTLVKGQQATATVRLVRPTKVSTTLQISQSTAYTLVPPVVTIPAGASSATFKITGAPSPAASSASVKVVNPDDSKTCALTILKAF